MAYTTAQAKQVDKSRAVIIFTGDSGEEAVALEMPIGADKGVWVYDRLAELNAKRVVTTGKPVQEGEVIAATAPPAPVLSAQQVYEQARVAVLKDAQDTAAGITVDGAVASAHLSAANEARAALDTVKG